MTTLSFPTSPTVGQLYSFGAKQWRWTGTAWAAVINAGQVVSVFALASGPWITTTVTGLPNGFPTPPTNFVLLTHT